MALWRIESKNTDLILCVNYPVQKAGQPRDEEGERKAKQVFDKAVETLEVKDLNLFAG